MIFYLLIISIWCIFWWIFAFMDFHKYNRYLYVPNNMIRINIPFRLQRFLNIFLFPFYVIFQLIKFLIQLITYIIVEILFQTIIVNIIRALMWISKGIFSWIFYTIFDR